MPSDFRPLKAIADFDSDVVDEHLEFARDFSLIANLIESARDKSEIFALYLSTCRNAYLTINAMYFDLREVFGRVSPFDGLLGALQLGQAGAFDAMRARLDAAKEVFDALLDKQKCWESRDELAGLLTKSTNGLGSLDRLAVEKLLRHTIDTDANCYVNNVQRFYAFNNEVTPVQVLLLQHVSATAQALIQVLKCIDNIIELGTLLKGIAPNQSGHFRQTAFLDQLLLPDIKSKAATMYNVLNLPSTETDMRIIRDAIARNRDGLLNRSSPHEMSERLLDSNDPNTLLAFLAAFSEDLQYCVGTAYTRFGTRFSANVGRAPLPPPFLIDLSEPPAAEPIDNAAVKATEIPFRQTPKERITVAIAHPPFGSDAISENTVRYNEAMRAVSKQWSIQAITAASNGGADLIVFPELFAPAEAVTDLRRIADDLGIALVSGIEGISEGPSSQM